jgi:hypothetical protein
MANTIKIKHSSTASATPSSLEYGELAINYADGKLFYKNDSAQIVEFSSGGGSSGSSYVTTLGNGSSSSFSINHNLRN